MIEKLDFSAVEKRQHVPVKVRLRLVGQVVSNACKSKPLARSARVRRARWHWHAVRELARLAARLKPLASDRMPLDVPPPRTSRFGSPLVLSRVHWVGPELVAEVTYLEWTDDGLRRQVVYQGLREDKLARLVRRDRPPLR